MAGLKSKDLLTHTIYKTNFQQSEIRVFVKSCNIFDRMSLVLEVYQLEIVKWSGHSRLKDF